MAAANILGNLNQSVWDACEIIKYLTGRGWCRLKDISQDLNIEQAKAHRLLNTLAAHDFVQCDADTRKYRLGLRFYTISYQMSRDSIISTAKVFLEQAASNLLETVNMGMLSQDNAKLIHVYRLEGKLPADFNDVPLGVGRYINESALGKAILAYLPFGQQRSVMSRLSFTKYTDTSIVTLEDLQQDIAETVKRGYAIDNGEMSPACYCVAMPVFDSSDQVVAAVSISMQAKPQQNRMAEVLQVLRYTTKQISAHI